MDTRIGGRSPLELGALTTMLAFGIAAVAGVIAVLDADQVLSGFGTGFGVAFLLFLAGGTIACALACLKRAQIELVALGSIVATGIAIDLLVLAIWLDIDNEAYGKVAFIAFVWSLFALVILGLTLAVGVPAALGRWVYLAAVATAVAAGLISTWLIATAGGDTSISGDSVSAGTGVVGDDGLLRALGVAFVLLAALWFAALAASRLERRVPTPSVPATPTV